MSILARAMPPRNHWLQLVSALLTTIVLWSGSVGQAADPQRPEKIGFHRAVYDAEGKLLPWTSWDDALCREVNWYLKCPVNDHGYPVFVFTTFMDGQYKTSRMDSIPCTQNGMGILSYLKYWQFTGGTDARLLRVACTMGDYLVRETLTPNRGPYPRFTRSTGFCIDFPLFRSSQGDVRYGRNIIEPDKGGIAGYALLRLYDATGNRRYLQQAVHNAKVLASNMREGNQSQSPWPFRVDSVTGQYWGQRSSNMVFILRLFDALVDRGDGTFRAPRDRLWNWIKTYQIASPDEPSQCLWVQFFEDFDLDTNRNSWAPLETARYLIERKEKLDPQWKDHAGKLIQFAIDHFSFTAPGGVTLMGEQDYNKSPWGGACSKLGGVAAMFYAAGGGDRYKEIAYRNLTWMTYFIDDDGCPSQKAAADRFVRGGWQEDCHTDVLHNFVDAMRAVPQWATGLHGPSDRKQITGLLSRWRTWLMARNVPQIMTLYAENFTSHGRDKAAEAQHLTEVVDADGFRGAAVVVDNATITIEGDKAAVLPISICRRTGASTFALELAKQNGQWLIVEMSD